MSYLNHTIVSILILACSAAGWSQQTYRSCYGFDCKQQKWSMSVFTGYAFSNAGRDIKAGLEHAGWAAQKPVINKPLECFPIGHYLKQTSGVTWSIQSRYNLSAKSVVEVSAGNSYNSIVEGFDFFTGESEVRFKSDLWNVTFNYVWRHGRGNGGLNIGPVIGNFRTVVDYPVQPGKPSSVKSKLSTGINVGYTLSLIQKRNWFLAMKANYTWMPPMDIGPYTIQHNSENVWNTPDAGDSIFETTPIRLETLQLGLTTGWRF